MTGGHDALGPFGTTRVAGVIGHPVEHSLSPVLHNAAFRELELDWVYVAFPVSPGAAAEAVAAVRALGLAGLNVTMPHKEAVVGALDRVSPTAERLQSVNTIFWIGDELAGDSTDGRGFLDSLVVDQNFDPAGRRCVVFGAGGAARAVVLALADAGAGEVVVVNRSPDKGERAAELAGSVGRVGSADDAAGADLVVNATPVGMGADRALPVDPSHLGPGQVVCDLVYHPLRTPLLAAARDRGAVAVSGLGMLIHQAAHAFRLWTGEEAPVEAMSAAALHALSHRNLL